MNDLNSNNLNFNYGIACFVSHDYDYLLIRSFIHPCSPSFSAQNHTANHA